MAVEGLTLTPPTGSAIDLNGSKWGLEALSIGQPARREELVSSLDADGGLPARVSPREVREVTATVRLLDAANMNAAMNSIGTLEAMLESAERLAASNPTNPVLDLVRLVYTPAGSTYSYSLIVLAAEITDIPREMSGDGLGFFIARPVVTIRAICDPFAYGTTGSSPFTTTYLDATTTLGYGVSSTVAGGVGDVSPWLRLKVKDVDSKTRSRVIAGVRVNESGTSPVIPVSGTGSVTAVVGTVSSGVLTASSTEWVVSASLPRQTRTGSFRVYLAEANSNSTGSARLVSAEVGGSKKTGPIATVDNAGRVDAYLGEVVADSSWDGWIETTGSVKYSSVILIPTDSFVEVVGAQAGRQMVGTVTIADSLATTSTELNGRTVTTGSGTWTGPSSGWPVSATNWARRTATFMFAPVTARITGTGTNYIGLDLKFRTRTSRSVDAVTLTQTTPVTGAIARYVDDNTYLFVGWRGIASSVAGASNARPVVAKLTGAGSSWVYLWQGEEQPSAFNAVLGNIGSFDWNLQVLDDGRWWVNVKGLDGLVTGYYQEGYGQDADLVSGATLGNTSNAKVGLYDWWQASTPALTRDITALSVSALVGVTPPPIPSGATLTLAGPKMTNADGAEYPYIGSSGIKIRPGVNNNLTVAARRSSGYLASGAASTDPLDLDIDGYPRFISVPHT